MAIKTLYLILDTKKLSFAKAGAKQLSSWSKWRHAEDHVARMNDEDGQARYRVVEVTTLQILCNEEYEVYNEVI